VGPQTIIRQGGHRRHPTNVMERSVQHSNHAGYCYHYCSTALALAVMLECFFSIRVLQLFGFKVFFRYIVCLISQFYGFSALTLLVGRQEEHLACKN